MITHIIINALFWGVLALSVYAIIKTVKGA
jgi:hypothetical protein